MIYESLGAVCAVESMRHSYSSSLMIFDSLGAVLAVECSCRMGQQFVDDF